MSQAEQQPGSVPRAFTALGRDELSVLLPHLDPFDQFMSVPSTAAEAGFERVYSTLSGELARAVAAHVGVGRLSFFVRLMRRPSSRTGIRAVARRVHLRRRLKECAFLEELVGAAAAFSKGRPRDVDRFLSRSLGLDPHRRLEGRMKEEGALRLELEHREPEVARARRDAFLEGVLLDFREELARKLRAFDWWVTKKARRSWLSEAIGNDADRAWRRGCRSERVWFRGADVEEPQRRGAGPELESWREAREELSSAPRTPEDDLLAGALKRLTEELVLGLPQRHQVMVALIKSGTEPMEAAARVARTSSEKARKAAFVSWQNALFRRLLDLPRQEFLELLDARGIPRSKLPAVVERMRRRVGG